MTGWPSSSSLQKVGSDNHHEDSDAASVYSHSDASLRWMPPLCNESRNGPGNASLTNNPDTGPVAYPGRVRVSQMPLFPEDLRRESKDSDATLINSRARRQRRPPLPPPDDQVDPLDTRFPLAIPQRVGGTDRPVEKSRGILSHILDWHRYDSHKDDEDGSQPQEMYHSGPFDYQEGGSHSRALRRMDSLASLSSQVLDPRDVRVTGHQRKGLVDIEDATKVSMRDMDYKSRQKEKAKIRIEIHICCAFTFRHLSIFVFSPLS